MPVATPEIYAQMLDTAKEKGFAFPAINVSSSQTLNAALKGFAVPGWTEQQTRDWLDSYHGGTD